MDRIGEHGYAPLPNSSSTSTSCSAAMLKSAVTLYRLVFLLVRRLVDIPPGDWGVEGWATYEDMMERWKG